MDIDQDVVKLLAELAFIAGGHGMSEHTDILVKAMVILRPNSERPYLILALARLAQHDASGAEYLLRDRALKINPHSALALAYLGLVLHSQGRMNERDQVLGAVLDGRDHDAGAEKLARTLLSTTLG